MVLFLSQLGLYRLPKILKVVTCPRWPLDTSYRILWEFPMNGDLTFPMLRRASCQIMSQFLSLSRNSEDIAHAAASVLETLVKTLSQLVGHVGSLGLFRHSLRLTEGRVPCYREMRDTKEDLLLQAAGTCLQRQPPDIAREAASALLTSYVTLLATFIGERLTWQLLHDQWPDIVTVHPEEKHE